MLQFCTVSDFINPKWLSMREELLERYQSTKPFSHIVLDNFLRPEVAEFVYANFPEMEQMPTLFREPMSFKGQLSDIEKHKPEFSELIKCLQSLSFRHFLSQISDIKDLIDDPVLAGGGLHQSPKSGFLDLHVDANFHPFNKSWHRRLNLLIYINKHWNSSWGGKLELWSNRNKRPHKLVQTIDPLFNRAVIFSTSRTSWHGVTPIQCPENATRKSIALYYYTVNRPIEEQYKDSSVIWYSANSPMKQLLYPLMNLGIATIKPCARLTRRNVFDAQDKLPSLTHQNSSKGAVER